MKRNRKYCKYYNQRGRVTAYCEFLGNNLLCNKVCNMYVETRDKPALNIPCIIKSVCDHPWQECESVMGDGVLCRKCNTVIKQTDI